MSKAMKRRHRRCTRLAISSGMACAALVVVGGVAAQNQPADPSRGRQLYYDHGCYGCHGFNGETGARALVGTGSSILESPDTFVAFLRLRADAVPLLPSTRMPSYSVTALSDGEARDIYSYIRTFVLHAPDPKPIGTLQTIVDSARAPYKAPERAGQERPR
jgi:cytochrome c